MITISHTHADGTLVEGSRKGDGVYELLKGLYGNWRYFPSLRQIGIGQSRDKAADTYKINRAAEALRAAGHEVTVEIDEGDRRSFAEAEADRYARAEDRAEYHEELAGVAQSRADGHWNAERGILDMIPMGQPILVGHHSEGRHRRDLARADSHMRHGLEEIGKRDYHEGRASSAERFKAVRENIPVTLRRIEKLEAEERQLVRRRDGSGKAMHGEDTPATGAYLERLTVRLADIAEELAYWRKHVADQEEAGLKIWSRADFAKGDFVRTRGRWYQVERVNPKSLSVPSGINDHLLAVVTRAEVVHAMGPSQWVNKITYDDVTGRQSADEMAAIVAESDRRLAESAAS